jgi:hypothetical protein
LTSRFVVIIKSSTERKNFLGQVPGYAFVDEKSLRCSHWALNYKKVRRTNLVLNAPIIDIKRCRPPLAQICSSLMDLKVLFTI